MASDGASDHGTARQAHRGSSSRRSRRGLERQLGWALVLVLPVATLAFGTVHGSFRLGLAVVAGLTGALALARAGSRRGASADARAATGLGLLAAVVAGLAFLPMPASLRAALQPDLAPALELALAAAGRADTARPLALDPARGLVEWAVFVAMVLMVGGTAAVTRNRRRARRVAGVLVGTGLGVLAIALLHEATGAVRIWWTPPVPAELGRPFFAPFVNPNHAGVLMAVAAPSALALLRDRKDSARVLGAVGLLGLIAGALLSGSRGAIVLLGVGLAVSVALSGPRAVKSATLALFGLALLGVVLAGPGEVAGWLTAALDPAQQAAVAGGYEDVWSGRQQVYAEVRAMLPGALALGVGPAGFDEAWRVLRTGTGFTLTEHAHQEMLQAVIEHGLPATLLALAALLPLGRAALRPDPDGGQGQARLQAGFAGGVVVVILAAMYELPLRSGAVTVAAALCAGSVLGLAGGRVAGPGGRRLRTVLGLAGALLLVAAAGLHLGARLADRTAYAPAAQAETRALAILDEAGIDLAEGWTTGGDPAALAAAGEAYSEALLRQPVSRASLQRLARIRYRQGNPLAAVAALEAAAAVYPTLPWAWRDLARLHRAQGDDVAAWGAWNRALSFDLPPDFPVDRWIVEALQGPGGAMVAALVALPARADRWEAAARVVEDAGYRDESDLLYAEAALLDPSLRAQHAFALLRWGQAAEALDRVPAEAATSCGDQQARASALLQLARCEEAVTWAQRALATCGSDELAVRLLVARSRLCAGDPRAVESLAALLREAPELHGARRSYLRALAERGRRQEALEQLEILDRAGAMNEADRALQQDLRR